MYICRRPSEPCGFYLQYFRRPPYGVHRYGRRNIKIDVRNYTVFIGVESRCSVDLLRMALRLGRFYLLVGSLIIKYIYF